MHLVRISLSSDQAVWKMYEKNKKKKKNPQLWGKGILKPWGISSVARRKAAKGIGSLKLSLWGMPRERRRALLRGFFHTPVKAVKNSTEKILLPRAKNPGPSP